MEQEFGWMKSRIEIRQVKHFDRGIEIIELLDLGRSRFWN
jgi:hypothetical protein